MTDQELIAGCLKNDKSSRKLFFETFFGKLSPVALRYAKNKQQADEILNKGLTYVVLNLSGCNTEQTSLEKWVNTEFILFTAKYIRSIRGEYAVASTVRATDPKTTTYDLFLDNVAIDYKTVEYDVLIKSLHQLVPSNRLIFNLHVVDGFSLSELSEILETSEYMIKSHLEKARYNLQKNIESNIKASQNEQPV